MNGFDFDTPIERHGTWSAKYDGAKKFGKPEGLIPLWVADMDFPAPPAVREALQKCVDFGIYGYSTPDDSYTAAVIEWFARRHGWTPKAEWLVKTPGVCVALAMAVRALTKEGDGVLIQPPVYYPFADTIKRNRRTLIENNLIYEDGKYRIDFDDFEAKVNSGSVKAFILCNPHNPVCRVWTRGELRRMGEICRAAGVYVISDEIHCDITLPGHDYTPFLLANPELEAQTVVCTAPSKTFNLAGLQASNIWIPSAGIRRAFQREIDAAGLGLLNLAGLVACKAAYSGGDAWLDDCLAYIRGNLDMLRGFLKENLPEIKLIEPEGTYFAWLDCSALGFESADALDAFITDRAGLWLDAGQMFGAAAGQFQRVVLACRRSLLSKALDNLKKAVDSLR